MDDKKEVSTDYDQVHQILKGLDFVSNCALPLVTAGTIASFVTGPASIIAATVISGSAILLSKQYLASGSQLSKKVEKLFESGLMNKEEEKEITELLNRLQKTRP